MNTNENKISIQRLMVALFILDVYQYFILTVPQTHVNFVLKYIEISNYILNLEHVYAPQCSGWLALPLLLPCNIHVLNSVRKSIGFISAATNERRLSVN